MVKLYNAATNRPLGDITDDQLHYYINTDSIDMLSDAGADPALLALLQLALGAAAEAEIRWTSE